MADGPAVVIGLVELASAAILALHWALAAGDRRERLAQSAAIALGAFVGEEVCVRAEGAYRYAAGWHVRLDALPLAVLLIWPSVVLSAWALARGLSDDRLQRALLTFALTWLDATLVEPIASHADLWTWSIPGPFHVSWIGPFGWGAYAFGAALCLEWRALVWLPLVAPAVAQSFILAAYWSVARWLPQPSVLDGLCADLVPPLLASVAAVFWRRRFRLPWSETVPRMAAALLFFALLAWRCSWSLALLAFAIAVPYLLLLPPIGRQHGQEPHPS